MNLNLEFLPLLIFFLSMMGLLLNSSNMLLILMNMEIMLLSLSLNFLISCYYSNILSGQMISIFVITVAAVESAMGLSIMISFYKLSGSVSMKLLNLLSG